MAWFKVDDGFWSHPKVIGLSPAAVALWVRSGSYCAQHLTGGEVSVAMVRMLGAGETEANELVGAGLWDSKENGYSFHDWDVYQPSSSSTKERRDEISRKRAEAGRKGAMARWGKGDDKTDSSLPSGPDGNEMAPSRPVPSISTDVDIGLSTDKSADGTLLPEDWRPNQKHIDRANALHLDVRREYHFFRDHAERKQRRQKDWNGAFTNWLRKQAEFAQERQGASRGRPVPAVQENLARLAALEEQERSSQLEGIES